MLEQLAEALAAVHESGLVHGDVKASNVMLEDGERAVLMDFGAGSEASSSEALSPIAASPLSMAPELFAGAGATQAADVYALGVLTFRLLTGRYPIEAADLEALASRHRDATSNPWRSTDRVPVVLKKLADRMLRRDPEARPDAHQLLESIRWIADAPRRRRRRLATAAVMTSLVIALVASSVGWVVSRRAERDAISARMEAEATSDFLGEMLLAPGVARKGPDVKVLEAMEEAERLVDETLTESNVVRGRVLELVGEVRASLGEVDEGIALLSEAESAFDEVSHDDDSFRIAANRAALLTRNGRPDEASALLQKLKRRAANPTPDAWRAWLSARAYLATVQGDLGEAESRLREMLTMVRGSDDEARGVTSRLAIVLEYSGQLEEAEALYRQNLAELLRTRGERNSNTLAGRNNLAGLLARTGHLEEAEEQFGACRETARDWLGEDDVYHLACLGGLINVIAERGDLEGASRLDEKLISLAEAKWGSAHPRTLVKRLYAASRLVARGETQEAESRVRSSIPGLESTLGGQAPSLVYAKALLAQILVETGRAAEAEQLVDSTLEQVRSALGDDSPNVLLLESRLGEAWHKLGRLEDAKSLLERVLERQRQTIGRDTAATLCTQVSLADVEAEMGHDSVAERLFCDALAAMERVLGADHPKTCAARKARSEWDCGRNVERGSTANSSRSRKGHNGSTSSSQETNPPIPSDSLRPQ